MQPPPEHDPPPGEPTSSCANCGADLVGRFCAQCGQEDRAPVLPVTTWLREATTDLLQLDVRLFSTIGTLVRRPGELTRRYLAGHWSEQTPPLRLYLIVSAISIGLMSLFGFLKLDALLANSESADLEVLRTLFGVEDPHDPLFQSRFNRRLNTVFPIFNLITPFALCLSLALIYRRRLLQEHLIFALHYSTAMVAYGSLLVPLLPFLGVATQAVLAAALFAWLLLYLLLAMRRHYDGTWKQLLWRTSLVYLSLVVIAQVIAGLSFWLVLQTI